MFPISNGKLPSILEESAQKYPIVKFPIDLGSLDKLVSDTDKYFKFLQAVSEVRRLNPKESYSFKLLL
jgi:hypothetical protein